MTPTPQQILELAREAEIGDSHGYIIQQEAVYLQRFATLLLERYGRGPAVQQEPVAVRHRKTGQLESAAAFAEPYNWGDRSEWEFLYTHPAPAEVREPLTDVVLKKVLQETAESIDSYHIVMTHWPLVARAVEAAHGITGSKK